MKTYSEWQQGRKCQHTSLKWVGSYTKCLGCNSYISVGKDGNIRIIEPFSESEEHRLDVLWGIK